MGGCTSKKEEPEPRESVRKCSGLTTVDSQESIQSFHLSNRNTRSARDARSGRLASFFRHQGVDTTRKAKGGIGEEEAPPPPPPPPGPPHSERRRVWTVGSRIEVWWEVDQKWYPGTVAAIHGDAVLDRTVDINYDDGETEAAVAGTLVRSRRAPRPSTMPSLGEDVSFRGDEGGGGDDDDVLTSPKHGPVEDSFADVLFSSFVSISVVNAVSGEETAFLEDVDPATTTVADVKAKIHEKQPDIAVKTMQLYFGADHTFLEEGGHTVASYGVADTEATDIVTLQLVRVATLTQEEKDKAVWDAAESGMLTKSMLQKNEGANLNWQNPNWGGATPCYIATGNGHLAALAALIGAGVDVDLATTNRDQATPCRTAVWNGREATLRLLIKTDADVNRVDGDRKTPLDIAFQRGARGCITILKAAGALTTTSDEDVVQYLYG